MASNNSSLPGVGVGFFGLLGLLFIGLKLGNVIDWSWWLVLLPLYGPLACLFALCTMCMFLIGLATYLQQRS